jgi:hypothetical protein
MSPPFDKLTAGNPDSPSTVTQFRIEFALFQELFKDPAIDGRHYLDEQQERISDGGPEVRKADGEIPPRDDRDSV